MKKALDYVSDYQLESARTDAPCSPIHGYRKDFCCFSGLL